MSWDKVWNHRVHEKLGETLFYYFVRVRPFERERSQTDLKQIIDDNKLGSVRIFPIFGPYDLLIRTWLYPTTANRFADFLDLRLRGYRDVNYFAVTHIYHRWYSKEINRRIHAKRRDSPSKQSVSGASLLDALSEPSIRSIEADKNPELARKLTNADLLIERPKRGNLIRFFVPIRFSESTPGIISNVVRDLAAYLEDNTKIQFWSLYGGYGFCSLLVTASMSSDDYEQIASIPNWIGEEFQDFGASTETYLAHGYKPMILEPRIAEATFREIAGKDLFVQTILPELYELPLDDSVKEKVKDIELFLKDQVQRRPIGTQDRNLLHDALLAYLKGAPSEMVKTLLIFFIDVESYLRDNLLEFIGRALQKDPYTYLEERGMPKEKGKFATLGDLLTLYHSVLNQIGNRELAHLDTSAFVWVRNQIAHEGVNAVVQWRDIISKLVDNLGGVRDILAGVQDVTKRPFVGTY